MKNATLMGKPDAGNPHARFDEGEVASAQPRRGSLLYNKGLKMGLVMAAMAGIALGAHAADVYSDAVISFRANLMKDENGDGVLNASAELLDCIDSAGTGHSKYGRWPTGTPNHMHFRKENVANHSFPGTNEEQVIWFEQPRTEVSRDEANDRVTYEFSPNVIWISALGGAVSTNYTTYARVRLDPVVPFRDNKFWLFNLGFSDQVGGMMVGFSGSGNSRALEIMNGAFYLSENPGILTDTWFDIAVSVQGPPKGELGDVKVGVVIYQEGKISFAKEYTKTITVSTRSTKPSGTQLTLGAEANNDGNKTFQSTYKISDGSWVSSTGGNQCKCFIGSLAELTLWNRALSIAEMQSVIRMHDGKLWQLGVKNGKSLEFTGTEASATAVNPRDAWWGIKPGLAAGEKHAVKFPVRDTMNGQPVLFSYATASGSTGGEILVTLNGKQVGEAVIPAGAQTVSFYVPEGMLKTGQDNEIIVERTDSGSGSIVLDSCWMGGTWRLGYQDSSFNEFCHEGANWATYYIDDYRFNRLRRVMHNYKDNNVDYIHFMVPEEALNDNFRWDLDLSLCGGCSEDSELSVKLNDEQIDYRKGTAAIANLRKTYRIEASQLVAGDNVLELRNLANKETSDGKFIALDSIFFTLRQRKGMIMILK